MSQDHSYYDRLVSQGADYYDDGQYQQAIEAYDKAIKLNPNVAIGYGHRGELQILRDSGLNSDEVFLAMMARGQTLVGVYR